MSFTNAALASVRMCHREAFSTFFPSRTTEHILLKMLTLYRERVDAASSRQCFPLLWDDAPLGPRRLDRAWVTSLQSAVANALWLEIGHWEYSAVAKALLLLKLFFLIYWRCTHDLFRMDVLSQDKKKLIVKVMSSQQLLLSK